MESRIKALENDCGNDDDVYIPDSVSVYAGNDLDFDDEDSVNNSLVLSDVFSSEADNSSHKQGQFVHKQGQFVHKQGQFVHKHGQFGPIQTKRKRPRQIVLMPSLTLTLRKPGGNRRKT